MIKCKYVWIIIKFNIPEGKGSIGFVGETLWALRPGKSRATMKSFLPLPSPIPSLTGKKKDLEAYSFIIKIT